MGHFSSSIPRCWNTLWEHIDLHFHIKCWDLHLCKIMEWSEWRSERLLKAPQQCFIAWNISMTSTLKLIQLNNFFHHIEKWLSINQTEWIAKFTSFQQSKMYSLKFTQKFAITVNWEPFLYLHFCLVEYDGNLYAPQQAD